MRIKYFGINNNTGKSHNIKRILAGLVTSAVVMSTFFVGCGADNIPTDSFMVDTYTTDDTIPLEVDTEKNFELKKPVDDCDISLSLSNGLSANIKDNTLSVTGTEIGEKEIDATIKAQGFKETDVKLKFEIVPHELSIEALELNNINDKETAKAIVENKVFFTRGSKKGILLESNTTPEYTVESDNNKVTTTIADGILTLSADEACEANITVKATAEKYSDAEYTFKAVVKPTKTNITTSESNINIELGKKHIINLTYDEKTSIELGYSKEIINVARLDNKLSVTALKEGTGKITITAQKEGYLPTTKQISVTVTDNTIVETGKSENIAEEKPLVGIGLDEYDLNLKEGEVQDVLVATDPSDATIKAEVVSGDASCTVNNKTLEVTGGSKKSQIKIIADHKDNSPSYILLDVDVIVEPEPEPQLEAEPEVEEVIEQEVEVETPSSRTAAEIIRLTNEYREENGVAPLKYVSVVDEPAQIRADEASEVWSHTRPDGTNYNTVFNEVGLSYRGNGENLFMATYTPSAKEIVDAWINSPGHRANLVREEFTGIGIGICKTSDGEYYCSQLFIID